MLPQSYNTITRLHINHHHAMPLARISLTLSCHFSPLFIASSRSSWLHPVSSHMFELVVLLLPGHMWGSIRVHHLWAHPCFFSCVLHVWFILLYGCATWMLTKRLEKKLDGNYTRMLWAILNKSWRQHPTRHQLYGHLPPITKTIQI